MAPSSRSFPAPISRSGCGRCNSSLFPLQGGLAVGSVTLRGAGTFQSRLDPVFFQFPEGHFEQPPLLVLPGEVECALPDHAFRTGLPRRNGLLEILCLSPGVLDLENPVPDLLPHFDGRLLANARILEPRPFTDPNTLKKRTWNRPWRFLFRLGGRRSGNEGGTHQEQDDTAAQHSCHRFSGHEILRGANAPASVGVNETERRSDCPYSMPVDGCQWNTGAGASPGSEVPSGRGKRQYSSFALSRVDRSSSRSNSTQGAARLAEKEGMLSHGEITMSPLQVDSMDIAKPFVRISIGRCRP